MDHFSGYTSEHTPRNGHPTMVTINSPCSLGIDINRICLYSGIGLHTKFSKLLVSLFVILCLLFLSDYFPFDKILGIFLSGQYFT